MLQGAAKAQEEQEQRKSKRAAKPFLNISACPRFCVVQLRFRLVTVVCHLEPHPTHRLRAVLIPVSGLVSTLYMIGPDPSQNCKTACFALSGGGDMAAIVCDTQQKPFC